MLYRAVAALLLAMSSLSAAAPTGIMPLNSKVLITFTDTQLDQSYKSVIISGGDVVPAENEHIQARAAAYKSVIITGGDIVPPEEEK